MVEWIDELTANYYVRNGTIQFWILNERNSNNETIHWNIRYECINGSKIQKQQRFDKRFLHIIRSVRSIRVSHNSIHLKDEPKKLFKFRIQIYKISNVSLSSDIFEKFVSGISFFPFLLFLLMHVIFGSTQKTMTTTTTVLIIMNFELVEVKEKLNQCCEICRTFVPSKKIFYLICLSINYST